MKRRVVLAGCGVLLAATAAVAAGGPSPARGTAVTDSAPAAFANRFELKGSWALLFRNKRLAGSRAAQSFAFDNAHRRIYVAELGPGATSGGNLYITQLNWSGTRLGHMTLKGFGHGVSIGLEVMGSTPYLWTEVDVDPKKGRGRRIARFKYAAGRTLTSTSSALKKFDLVPGATAETVSIDQTYKRIVLRYFKGTSKHYATYDLAAFQKKHVFTKVYADIKEPSWMSTPSFQGYTTYDRHLYMVQGTAYGTDNARSGKGDTMLTSVDLATGRVEQRQVRTTAGSSLYTREPEGLAIQVVNGAPRLCIGFATTATATSTTRLFTVYDTSKRV
ncbi:hypothetical protein NE236_14510 [Actinoallomurus purpureus]|uniref:phage baseplate protein n=1 Tax=Actinoallomurus purpureus TaxID=478114 RepID=UPI0020933BE0|nr:hypothetical protein [Actinoallomurus purpureus]MCO6006202.1 hypothetical protein [Actinoallomurus purpureus]